MSDEIEIKRLIMGLAEVYREKLSPGRLQIYFELLSQHTAAEVDSAVRKILLDPTQKFFPLPAVILEKINPTITAADAAQEILTRCIDAVAVYGYYQPGPAKQYIGEEGWAALPGDAGWGDFCQTPMGDAGMVRAQLRERIAARLRRNVGGDRVAIAAGGVILRLPKIGKDLPDDM